MLLQHLITVIRFREEQLNNCELRKCIVNRECFANDFPNLYVLLCPSTLNIKRY